MTSKEIAAFIGKRIFLRRIMYWVIYLTTLREWYIRKALKMVLEGKKVFTFLDAGTGLGQHAVFVSRLYPHADVLGVDTDKDQVEDNLYFAVKTKLNNLNFKQNSLLNIKETDKFDFILCASVLEHIKNDKQVLNLFYRALNYKGCLIIYVPASERRVFAFLGRKIHKMTRAKNAKYPHDHARYYSVQELQTKLEKTGFDIIEEMISYGPYGRLSYDIVTGIQYSPFFKYIFPFYFFLVHPFVLLLMWADLRKKNHEGNGMLIIAQKADKVE
ncbi:methyltransferase domain-containing protein [candidate division KSB1 bacterium]|nr:methyltransferase domain-containing protein [candidate division KSB1 bacterium]